MGLQKGVFNLHVCKEAISVKTTEINFKNTQMKKQNTGLSELLLACLLAMLLFGSCASQKYGCPSTGQSKYINKHFTK